MPRRRIFVLFQLGQCPLVLLLVRPMLLLLAFPFSPITTKAFSFGRRAVMRKTACSAPPFVSTAKATGMMSSNDNNAERTGSDDANDDGNAERKRMAQIRALQNAFYSSPPSPSSSLLLDDDEHDLDGVGSSSGYDDGSTVTRLRLNDGTIVNLPLFRVPWTILPGRSDVLHIHESRYTHLFESVLRSQGSGGSGDDEEEGDDREVSTPLYVGQLYLEGGTAAAYDKQSRGGEGTTSDGYRLDPWWALEEEDGRGGAGESSPSSVGTLLRIVDHRRFADGRILLLVHGLDRFVVTTVHRLLPYTVVDAAIVPDAEEVRSCHGDWTASIGSSFRWHGYECDAHGARLPIRDDRRDDVTAADVIGAALTTVLPLAPLSEDATLAKDAMRPSPLTTTAKTTSSQMTVGQDDVGRDESSLLDRLVEARILNDPPLKVPSVITDDDLERRVWMRIDVHIRSKKGTPSVRPELLGLLPPPGTLKGEWPEDFALEQAAAAAEAEAEAASETGEAETGSSSSPLYSPSMSPRQSRFVRVSTDYPAHRRRRKLSYAAAYLLEGTVPGGREALRKKLLEIPTTRDRLWTVLELF